MVIRNFKVHLICFFNIVLAGCAFGPFVSHETARTVGKSNSEFLAGYGQAGYVLKGSFGATDNLDIGLHAETLSIGLRVKYAFINNIQSGFSFSTALGAGSSLGGNHYYSDLMGSYYNDSWEPYGQLRLVHVNVDDYQDNSFSLFDIDVEKYSYQYGQVSLGTRYWFTKKVFLSIEASTLFSQTSGLSFNNPVFGGVAIGFK